MIVLLGFLIISPSLIYAQPKVQVIPTEVDFGEVEPYEPQVKTASVTISNCGTADSILCWGIAPETEVTWLTVESETRGMINLPNGDARNTSATLGACGLCVDEVKTYTGMFIVTQYTLDMSGTDPMCTDVPDPAADPQYVEIYATMTISSRNALAVDTDNPMNPNLLHFDVGINELPLYVINTGAGEMEWEAVVSEGADWLTVDGGTSANGITEGWETFPGCDDPATDPPRDCGNPITVRVNRSNLEGCETEFNASIKVTATDADPNEATVAVTMERSIEAPQPVLLTPNDGAPDQSLYTTLEWMEGARTSGVATDTFDVYFSTR